MKSMPGIVALLLGVALLLLAGCKPVTAPVADLAEETSVRWDAYTEDACKTYMDVDLERAYRRFQQEVFWTFHVNFLTTDTPDIVLGCLRYYWRNNEAGAFVGTLDSAAVIECKIVDNDPQGTDVSGVQPQSALADIPSSDLKRQPDEPSLPQRMAVFTGQAHVECPIDISATLSTLAGTPLLDQELGSLLPPGDASSVSTAIQGMILEPRQVYGEFMAAAAVGVWEPAPQGANPFFVYEAEPDFPLAADFAPQYELDFALETGSAAAGFDPWQQVYRATLARQTYWSTRNPNSEACIVESGAASAMYLWESFGQCASADLGECAPGAPADAVYLQFLRREIPRGGLTTCDVPPPVIQTRSVPFWSGPAVIYIGFHPRTQETFTGELYEVWIDPDSSVKPPE